MSILPIGLLIPQILISQTPSSGKKEGSEKNDKIYTPYVHQTAPLGLLQALPPVDITATTIIPGDDAQETWQGNNLLYPYTEDTPPPEYKGETFITYLEITGADYYKIYMRKKGETNWLFIGTDFTPANGYRIKISPDPNDPDNPVVNSVFEFDVRGYNETTNEESPPGTNGDEANLAITMSPANFRCTGVSQSSVTLEWDLPTDITADEQPVGYIVYRKLTSASQYSKLTEVGVVNTYTDTSIQSGESYDYKLRAVYKHTYQSVDSYYISPDRADNAAPEVKNVSPTNQYLDMTEVKVYPAGTSEATAAGITSTDKALLRITFDSMSRALTNDDELTVQIYNLDGTKPAKAVKVLPADKRTGNTYVVTLNLREAAEGTYLIKVYLKSKEGQQETKTVRFTYVK